MQIAKTTFASGEISPLIAPRDDLARQQSALAKLENFVVLPEGGCTRRPGTRYLDALKDETEKGRLVEFQYDDSDTYCLVFNDGKLRFFRNGGVLLDGGNPYEITSPFTEADLPNLRYAQSGNVLFLASKGKTPQVLTRTDHTDWTFSDYAHTDGAFDAQNLATADTIQASAATGTVTLTRVTGLFTADDIGTLWRLDEPDFAIVPQWKGNETGLSDNDQRRNGDNVYSADVTTSPAGNDSGPNAPTHTEGDFLAGNGNPIWTFLHAGYGTVRITAIGGGGATATATVIKRLPDSVVSNPTSRWYQPMWSAARGYPEEVRLHDGSLFFMREDLWWLSVPNDFYSFAITFDDESGLSGRILSPDGKRLTVRWALSQGLLVIGTAASEWSLRGATTLGALTTESVRAIPETGEGSAVHVPELVETGAFFIGKSRKRLLFARFEALQEKVETVEVSIASRHILAGKAAALGFQKDPNRVLWIVLEDGTLAGCTFMSSEEINGWHRHPLTNGFVEDVAIVTSADGETDDVYVIVRRTINGATRRYVEILEDFFTPSDLANPTASGAWFVDCGLSYSGTPVTTLSGLDHLEGETVRIVVNGAEQPDQVVTGGSVSITNPLPQDATNMEAVAGLKITAKARSLPFEPPPGSKGSVKGRMRQGVDAVLEMVHSTGGTLSMNDGPAEPIFEYGAEDYGDPLPAFTGKVKPNCEVPSSMELVAELVCDNALPFTLSGWAPDLDISEDRR